MKKCRRCGNENVDDALACQNCRHRAFELEIATSPPKSESRKFISKLPHLTIETAGTHAVLKCRTPSEAILVAEELEAADILVMFPDEEGMLQEFKTQGYVSIKVSAQSYSAAKELKEVIECRQWQNRGEQTLSIKMALVATGLGIMFCPGLIFFFMLYKGYERKGFSRKANVFGKWFIVGFAFDMVLIALASQ
jgi:hypothetical protein